MALKELIMIYIKFVSGNVETFPVTKEMRDMLFDDSFRIYSQRIFILTYFIVREEDGNVFRDVVINMNNVEYIK